jgi:hypothetical protein
LLSCGNLPFFVDALWARESVGDLPEGNGHYHVRTQVAHLLVYLDDIIIYYTSMEDHYHHVDEVLMTLGKAGLSLTLKNATSSRMRSTTFDTSFDQVVCKLQRRTPLPSKRPSFQRLRLSSSRSQVSVMYTDVSLLDL